MPLVSIHQSSTFDQRRALNVVKKVVVSLSRHNEQTFKTLALLKKKEIARELIPTNSFFFFYLHSNKKGVLLDRKNQQRHLCAKCPMPLEAPLDSPS